MRLIILLILLSLLTSCATVSPPPDIPVFEYLEQHLSIDPTTGHSILKPSPACLKAIGEFECGHGVYVMSGREVYIGDLPKNQLNGKTWTQLKAEAVFMPAVESYAPMSTWIINTCKVASCSSEVDAFKIKLNSLNGIAGALQNPP